MVGASPLSVTLVVVVEGVEVAEVVVPDTAVGVEMEEVVVVGVRMRRGSADAMGVQTPTSASTLQSLSS